MAAVEDPPARGARQRVRRHARDVALGATGVALAVYLLVCLVADLAVVDHLTGAVDNRLGARLAALVQAGRPQQPSAPGAGGRRRAGAGAVAGEVGLDDAPVVAWWIASGSGRAEPLTGEAPRLPVGDATVAGPRDVTLGQRSVRLTTAAVPGGRFAVGTSIEELLSIRATLLAAEAALLPVVLATFFLAAYAIAKGAAMRVERARAQQLEFTADASHELRTPLSVIEAEIGLALVGRRPPDELRGALERVGVESHRLTRIVDDLLFLARADGPPDERPPSSEVDLAAVAEDAVARFAPVAAHRQLSLHLSVGPGDELVVRAPADWVRRLLAVLLDNACRYAPPGGGVEVGVASAGGRAQLRVDDSGPGIPAGALPAVLGRFHRASFQPGGAGLGLAIADAIVRSTGGRWELGRAGLGGARMGVSWPRSPSPLARPRARRVVGAR